MNSNYGRILSAFVAGSLFAVGLAIGGMTKPENVLGFLDITGTWKPALMFVMVGAIALYSFAYRLITKKKHPVLDSRFHIPSKDRFSLEVFVGSAIFGVGWGLAGFCPGPAFTSAGAGSTDAIILVVAMIAGMLLQKTWVRIRK